MVKKMRSRLRFIIAGSMSLALISLPSVWGESSSSSHGLLHSLPSNAFHFASVAISGDGSHLVAMPYETETILTSKNFGATWITRTLPLTIAPRYTGGYGRVAISDDGGHIAVVGDSSPGNESGGYIYTSSDFGATWLKSDSLPLLVWTAISGSASGKYLLAQGAPLPPPDSSAYAPNPPSIYTSSDFGKTWRVSKSLAPSDSFAVIGISDTGKFVVSDGVANYHSDDAGLSWSPLHSPDIPALLSGYAIPSGKAFFATDGSVIYKSVDFGKTWLALPSDTLSNVTTLSGSIDGSMILALESSGHLYESKNSGKTWALLGSSSSVYWSGNAGVDRTGKRLVATARGDLFISQNSGMNWENLSNDLYRDWGTLTMSGDGTHIFAGSSDGCRFEECPASFTDLFSSDNFGRNWSALETDSSSDGISLPDVAYSLWSDRTGKIIYSDDPESSQWQQSKDNGRTWLNQTPKSPRGDFANEEYDADGKVGITYDEDIYEKITVYLTVDSGKHWTVVTPPEFINPNPTPDFSDDFTFMTVSVSTNGQVITAKTDSRFFISLDHGKTWVHHASPWAQDLLKPHYECMNPNGSIISSLVNSGDNTTSSGTSPSAWSLYQSIDLGANWKSVAIPSELRSTLQWNFGLQCTPDGRNMYLLGKYPYVSTNNGKSWSALKSAGARNWSSLTFSDDGSHLAALGSDTLSPDLGSHIFGSTDFGKSWTDLSALGLVTWSSP